MNGHVRNLRDRVRALWLFVKLFDSVTDLVDRQLLFVSLKSSFAVHLTHGGQRINKLRPCAFRAQCGQQSRQQRRRHRRVVVFCSRFLWVSPVGHAVGTRCRPRNSTREDGATRPRWPVMKEYVVNVAVGDLNF